MCSGGSVLRSSISMRNDRPPVSRAIILQHLQNVNSKQINRRTECHMHEVVGHVSIDQITLQKVVLQIQHL